MNPTFYRRLTKFCRWILLPPYCGIEVKGLENLPLEGPLVIASNHLNDADPGIIATRIPRFLVFMAKDELFHVPVIKNIMTSYGALPVKRNEADIGALRRAAEELAAGKAIVIFPEGTRAGTRGSMKEAWPGAALIALRSDVPVLPVAITGSQRLSLPLMFLKPLLPRYKVTLTIGEPFKLERPARINGESAKAGTRVIMEHIASLLPPSYRGYYGSKAEAEPDPVEGSEA